MQETGTSDIPAYLQSLLTVLTETCTPPAYTTLRINSLESNKDEIFQHIQREISKIYKDRDRDDPVMYIHPKLSEVIVIESRGPNYHHERSDKEVIVDLACGMAVLRGADIFVQGIMGAPTGMQVGDKVSVYSDVDGQCKKGLIKPFTGKKIYVGNGVTKVSREELFCSGKDLSGVGILMTEPLYEAPSLMEFCPHLVFPQNLPSIGRVIAFDKTLKKVEKIKKNCDNWKITCVEPYVCDATKSVDEAADLSGGPPYPPGCFDRILLDGPCSALGQRPAYISKLNSNSLKSYPTYQRKLFTKAVDLLKPGGVLVYSTCTITLEENEKLVAWALRTFENLKLEPQTPHIGGCGRCCDGLTEEDLKKLQYFDPCVSSHEDTIKTM
ncbi:hypothetical protein KUTeg_008051 [Tegillarca granosa]|uniref:SAM-dependent MTase RsmB/NOP-type domain-containing protein n=1 Tax=Tegillarca granosa TaxID=220873 RepID=A0ABQ9F7Z7_TEGGR|nr:hypothetical protein KUTeg_008051 [Tegillarca granosa]